MESPDGPTFLDDHVALEMSTISPVVLPAFRSAMTDTPQRVVAALRGDADEVTKLQRQNKLVGTHGVKLVFDKLDEPQLRNICTAIRDSPRVTALELGCNGCGDRGAAILTEILFGCRHVEHVSIWGNGVTDKGAQSLADVIGTCPLRSLILSNNEIGDAGLSAMSLGIARSSTLRHVDLSVNAGMTDNGLQQLVQALKDARDSGIETLNLSNAGFSNPGCQYLGSWLSQPATCKKLTSVDLSYNAVEDPGAEALAAALRVNDTLTELNLSGNLFSRKGMKLLREQMDRRPGRVIVMEDVVTSSQF